MKHELMIYLTENEQESLETAYLIRNDINNLPLTEFETYNIIIDLIKMIERENKIIMQLEDKIEHLKFENEELELEVEDLEQEIYELSEG